MAEGITFGNLSANDRKLISNSRNIFEVMNREMDQETRSSTDSQKNNSTERFDRPRQETKEINDKNSLELNSSKLAIPVLQETKYSMRNFTNDNSGCRIEPPRQNVNNSAGSDRNISTQVGDNSTQTAEN